MGPSRAEAPDQPLLVKTSADGLADVALGNLPAEPLSQLPFAEAGLYEKQLVHGEARAREGQGALRRTPALL